MLAEIHGKISSTGSNLSDRLEDKLTGDVFGALRYMPAETGILKILNAVRFGAERVDFSRSANGYIGDCFHFWVNDKRSEIDLTIDLPDCVIGIEVKYNSGLSSDDGQNFDGCDELEETQTAEKTAEERVESIHQLNREAQTLAERYGDKKKYLIFIARRASCVAVYDDVINRGWKKNAKGVPLGFIGWEDVLETVKSAADETENPYYKRALLDIAELLKRKGFEDFLSVADGDLPLVTTEHFSFLGKEQSNFVAWKKEMKKVDENGYYVFE